MRTRFIFVFVFLLILSSLSGQYYYIPANINPSGNPGGLNYDNEEPYGHGLPSGWVNIDPMDNSPAWSAVRTIPFAFQFNAASVSQYKVSNTGILTFTTSAASVPGSSNNIIPDANIPDKSVCVWGISFSGTSSNDRIVVKTFGTAPNRQHWIQFNTYNIPGGHAYYTYNYFSIVLEETTNNIYVVDQRSNDKGMQPTLTVGVQINSTTATMVAGSPNLGSLAGKSKTPVDNKYYTFIHGTPPVRDVGVSWLQLGSFLILNAAPFDVKGKVKNYTGNMVNDYDINYSVNNGAPVTCNMSGSAYKINPYGEEWFIHDSTWTPPAVGVYHFKFWASNINGGNDQNNSNDTMYRTIEISTAFTPKLRLFEEFTSSTCPSCKDANDLLKSVLSLFPEQYAMIKYPMNYPDAGDPYYTAECEARKLYYGVDSLPDMYCHGTEVVDPLYIDTTQFNDLWDKSFMMFNPTHTIIGNTVNVSASILPFQNFNQGTFVVRFALVEKTTTQNVGTNGEIIFYNTFKKFIPDANGVNLGTLQQAVFKTVARSYTFPTPNTVENWNNLAVIVFVQDETTKEVMQAAYSQLQSSIDEPARSSAIVKLSPNPSNSFSTMHYIINDHGDVNIELVSISGQLIRTIRHQNLSPGVYQDDIRLDDLPGGLYFVRLQTARGSDVARLMVN